MSRAKPADQRLRHGDGNKVVELVPSDANVPDAPPWIADSELAAELWDTLWFVGDGFFDPALHYQTIARYVEMVDEVNDMRDALQGKRLTKGSQGQWVTHPLRKDFRETRADLTRLEKELGLTPEATLRLGLVLARKREADSLRDGVQAEIVEVTDDDS